MEWVYSLFIFSIGMFIGHIITYERLKYLEKKENE